jgi:hypothetical protein
LLNVIILSDVMLNVVILSVTTLNVAAPRLFIFQLSIV